MFSNNISNIFNLNNLFNNMFIYFVYLNFALLSNGFEIDDTNAVTIINFFLIKYSYFNE